MNSKTRRRENCKKHIFFRQFSRKKYAAFLSMHKVVHIATLVLGYTLIASPTKCLAQDDSTHVVSKVIDLDEVEIVGQMSPVLFEEAPRMVSVVTQSESQSAPSQSISDLLRYTGNLDIRQRGKHSIQTDLSIRGGSFDQSLILLNGINISDPQTGHLSLQLPFETDAIDRIEILNGPSARVHGANAFSGAINFVCIPRPQNTLQVSLSAGSFTTGSLAATANMASRKYQQLLHYNYSQSEGFAKNTDFRKQGIYYHGKYLATSGIFNVQFGYNMREFGANGYYTPKYPDQYEENNMTFASMGFKSSGKNSINTQVYWRRHRDRFELFREDENWYRIENGITISNDVSHTAFDTISWYSRHNHHINDVVGAQVNVNFKSGFGVTTLGWHVRSENIVSTNIGYDKGIVVPVRRYDDTYYTKSDNRSNMDVHLEQTLELGPVYLSGGFLMNWNSYLPDEVNLFPGIDLRYNILPWLAITGSYNYTLGLPTFTDLTYEDPSNVGNNELKPYSQQSIEGGLKVLHGKGLTSAVVFYNTGEDIIDWVWFSDVSRFSPVNVDEYNCLGFEISSTHRFEESEIPFSPERLRLSFTSMDMHKEIPGEVVKYFNLRNKFSAMIIQRIIPNLQLAWNVNYTEREGSYLQFDFDEQEYNSQTFEPYWLIDSRLAYTWRNVNIFFEVFNCLDTDYIDIGSILQPGRSYSVGVNFNLEK